MISSPGIGSNLDVNGIITQLMGVEKLAVTALDRKEVAFQQKLTAYGSLKGALSAFQMAARSASGISTFQGMKAISADVTVYTAVGSPSATAGSYAVEVKQLAQSQKLSSKGFADTSSALGTGTLSFQYGTWDGASFTINPAKSAQTVTITSSNNSLSGIRDAINAANIGVTASIVNDGSAGTPNKLVLTSKDTGAVNSLKITVSGDSVGSNVDDNGLSQLAYDPAGALGTGKNLTQTLVAQNAILKVDGLDNINKASNIVTDVVPGVTLNLLKASATGVATNVIVSRDSVAVKSAVESFVKAFNDLNKSVKDAVGYDAATKKGGVLQGDSSAGSIIARVRSTLNTAISYSSGAYNLLSQIGVSFQKDGTLSLDTVKLQKAIDSNAGDIAALFAPLGKLSDSLVSFASATDKSKPGQYAVDVTTLASQGKSTGNAAAGLTITAGVNDTLSFSVDAIAASVTLGAGVYASAAALAAEVQSRINGVSALSSIGHAVTVSESAGVISIGSNLYGSGSTVVVSGGNGKTNLLGAAPTETTGVDVVGSIGGAAAVGAGQHLTGASGTAMEGLKLLITGSGTGSRGTLNFSQGYAHQLDKLSAVLLGSDGPISSRTSGIDKSIKEIARQRDATLRRLDKFEQNLRQQFTALDLTVGQMRRTGDYLTQQLASLANLSRN